MNEIKPISRQYQEVGQKLIEELSKGQYQIGDRLPAERIFADEMGVTRAVLREAMIMLELLGLVEVKKGSGVYVKALPESTKEYHLAKDDKYQREHVGPFEMLQARQAIESRIAELAAIQITKNDILKLREALQLEKREIEESSETSEGDRLFHRYLAEATQNSVLIEIIEGMWSFRNSSPFWKKLHQRIDDNQSYRKIWHQDHQSILLKLQQKDAKGAGYAMWNHIENVKNTLTELSDVDDPEFDGFLFSTAPLVDKE